MENKKTSKPNFFKSLLKSVDVIILVLVCAFYILEGLFELRKTDKTLIDVVGSIGLSFIVALVIYISFRRLGLSKGRKDELFLASLNLYAEAKEKTKPYRSKTSAFCNYKNTQSLELAKKEYLEDRGLNYSLWKANGYTDDVIEKLQLNEIQRTALKEVKTIKIDRVSPEDLYSDLPYVSKYKRNKYGRFGEGDKNYSFTEALKDAATIILFSLVSGLYALMPILNEDSLSTVIWNIIQVLIWVSFGIFKYFSAIYFMVNIYRQTHIIQKTEILNEFISIIDNEPYLLENYDIEKIILEQKGVDLSDKK